MTIYIYIVSSAHPFHADVLQLCICSVHLPDGQPSSKYMNSQNVYAMKIINNSLEHSYKTIPIKRVKSQTGLSNQTYKSMYPTGCVPPSSMAFPRSTRQTLLLGLWCPAVGQSHMVWPKNLLKSKNP